MKKYKAGLPIFFLSLYLAFDFSHQGFFMSSAWKYFDFLQRSQMIAALPSESVVIIDVTQNSLERLEPELGRWPWPRSIYSEVIEYLRIEGAKAIVFDMLFTERDVLNPLADESFISALKSKNDVFLPYLLMDDGNPQNLTLIPKEMGVKVKVEDAKGHLLLPLAVPKDLWRGGFINHYPMKDGVARFHELKKETANATFESLVFSTLNQLGIPLSVNSNTEILLNWNIKRTHSHIDFSELYQEINNKLPQNFKGKFKDKVVIIGSTAAGLFDHKVTPLGSLVPGVDILATGFDNLIGNNYFKKSSHLYPFFLVCLIFALQFLIFKNGQIRLLGIFSAGVVILLLAIDFVALKQGYFFAAIAAAGPTFTVNGYLSLLSYYLERANREKAENLFGRFMDPRLVKQLLTCGEVSLTQKPEISQVTVLFSDIRGFTKFSEGREATEVVEMLNSYFEKQVEVIFKYNGVLDKFIGDAIMAFWGAPHKDENHATNAVNAAIEMMRVAENFNREMQAKGIDFHIGIGINSGPAFVGLIGAHSRYDYTVIGDTVNAASRIESLTKDIAPILVSKETKELCSTNMAFIDLGSHLVKGKSQELNLFTPNIKI